METEYATRPREAIAQILQGEPRFLSAAQVCARLVAAGHRVSRATVYRTLERLAAKGEASLRVGARGEATFIHCEPEGHHHHAICRLCGRVEEVACGTLDAFVDRLHAINGFTLDEHALEFYGRCRSCVS
ncbi:MAG TPA: transcriptional repressor [Candidatus Dormibacteraeota bacterium]|nr:transcriptional repressor [Candidatus Dormibacteraeota bacterium]